MISLQVLGGVQLLVDGRQLQSVLAQPKRQAVLFYLAVATPRGFHRRESLLALLWPELDDAHARAALSRAVHHLRQSLGNDVVLSRGHDEIGLDWSRFWCDAAGFESTLDNGQIAEALALYRGELLPGFYVDDAAEFEQWLGQERTRLRTRAVQTARLLSEREQAAGNVQQAIEWARRTIALAPFDEPAARRAISLLDEAGDRAGALREFEELSARLRNEVDADPAPETVQLIESIRRREPLPPRPLPTDVPVPAPAAVSSPPIVSRAASSFPPRLRNAIGFAAALLVIVSGLTLMRRASDGAADESSATVAIVPFVFDGDSSARYLGAGIVSLLAERFNQSGQLRALDARAVLNATQRQPATLDPNDARGMVAGLRPRFVVTGMVIARNDSLTISAALFDSVGARVRPARAAVSGPADEIDHLLETLAGQMMLAQPAKADVRLTPEPYTALTPSLEALKHYVAGEKAYASGHFNEAVREYQAAVRADTTFALAFLWLSRSANWAGDQATTGWAADRALKFADKLALLNQFRVRAWMAYRRGQAEEAERLYQAVLANDVGAADALQTLGELHYHWGPLLGWTMPQARMDFERAVAISARDASSIIHLARLAAVRNDVARLDSLLHRAEAVGVDELQRLELKGLRAFITGNRAEQREVLEAVSRLDDATANSVVIAIAVSTAQNLDARDIAVTLDRPGRSMDIRTVGALLAAQISALHGEWRHADSAMKKTPGLSDVRALEYRAVLAALPWQQRSADEIRSMRAAIAARPANPPIGPYIAHYGSNEIYGPRRAYLLGMLDLKLADTAAVSATVKLLSVPVDEPVDHGYRTSAANLLRAELLRSRGKPAEALAALGKPQVLPDSVLPGVLAYPSAHERFLRGELLRELGRDREALRWYETFPDPAGYDLMYLSQVRVARSQIHRRLGKETAARS